MYQEIKYRLMPTTGGQNYKQSFLLDIEIFILCMKVASNQKYLDCNAKLLFPNLHAPKESGENGRISLRKVSMVWHYRCYTKPH